MDRMIAIYKVNILMYIHINMLFSYIYLNKWLFFLNFYLIDVNNEINKKGPVTPNVFQNTESTNNLFEPITPSLVSNKSDLNGAYTNWIRHIFMLCIFEYY